MRVLVGKRVPTAPLGALRVLSVTLGAVPGAWDAGLSSKPQISNTDHESGPPLSESLSAGYAAWRERGPEGPRGAL